MNHFCSHNGVLHAERVSLETIAEQVGTPVYVYSKATLEENWNAFRHALSVPPSAIRYAVKSNSNIAVLALMARNGSGFDIVSAGELARVIGAGGDPKKTIFSGVAKSRTEIETALRAGIYSLNVESSAELERISSIAKGLERAAPVSVRFNPNVDAATHPHISTGLREAKFGIAVDQAHEVIRKAARDPHLELIGVAVHIGSQITTMEPIVCAIEHVVELIEQLTTAGIEVHHLDLGGGLGVRYKDENPPSITDYCQTILETLDRLNCIVPISVEPGRAITSDSGILLTKVEYLKNSPTKNFAVVDAGMNDLIRPALYDAWMNIVAVRDQVEEEKVYDVVGPICETADVLGKNRTLGIRPDDLLAILNAGAYGATMSSNYNSRARTAEVLVNDTEFHVVRERETAEQMLQLESIPDSLTS